MKPRSRRITQGPSAVELIEEAVHLLRRAPPVTLCIYYAGSASFALGLLFFWARTTWFLPSEVVVAWSALGLVVLFGGMKAAHADFCARLLAQRLGDAAPTLTFARLRRLALAQFPLQAWGILVLPVALVIGVPFGWVYAYFQSATVLGEGESLAAEARAQAKLWPGQNHLGQLLLSGALAAVWVNVASAFWTVPWLANRLLGIENLFGFSGWWIANTTFLASTAVMSWLAVDPLIKAFFTLRVFYGRARRNGEDVQVELRLAQRLRDSSAIAAPSRSLIGSGPGGGTTSVSSVSKAVHTEVDPPFRTRLRKIFAPRVALTVLAAMAGWGVATPLRANESAVPLQAVEPAQLNHAIDRVLARSDFQWRLRPLPQAAAEDAKNEGPVKRFFRAAVEAVRDFFEWLRGIWRSIRQWFGGDSPHATEPSGPAIGMATLEMLLWIFVFVVAGLLISVVAIAWHRARSFRNPVLSARAVAAVIPDLQDENTQAAQLPTDGWVALAREQLARGEWRLAWRALYLATLARLAAQGLVSLTKFKTNLDYERELRRRAIARQDVVNWFSLKRGAFEAVWYGRAPAEETLAREWLAELERPSIS
jgi:hypothetical protein